MSLNTAIWDQVYETDRRYTQAYNAGRFQGTAIKPMYLYRKATETFGPAGKGWGFQEIQSHRMKADGSDEVCWYSYVLFWWVDAEGVKHEIYQYGGAKMYSINARGQGFLDDEAPKKAITDAVTKCLSYLGFGGDIHMGDKGDSKYLSSEPSAPAATTSKTTVAPKTTSQPTSSQSAVVDQIKQTIAAITKPASLIRLADDLKSTALTPDQRSEINRLLDSRGKELTPDAALEPELVEA